MESFYSIIYYKPNGFTDELLAVGLLASGGEGPFIHISRRRLDLLKKTSHPSQYASIQRHLKNLVSSVNDDRRSPNELLLFDPIYSKQRLDELSQKTKGAVLYGQPTTINEWLNPSFFDELVQHFMGDKSLVSKKKRPIFQLKWKAFYRSKQCDSWERDIMASTLSSTDLPLNIDLLSQRQSKIVKGIDFDIKPETVKRKLHEIRLLADLFQNYEVIIVHPGPRKGSGRELLDSMKHTIQNIRLMNFSEFKDNS